MHDPSLAKSIQPGGAQHKTANMDQIGHSHGVSQCVTVHVRLYTFLKMNWCVDTKNASPLGQKAEPRTKLHRTIIRLNARAQHPQSFDFGPHHQKCTCRVHPSCAEYKTKHAPRSQFPRIFKIRFRWASICTSSKPQVHPSADLPIPVDT